jgi:hypothetical protein
MSVESINEPGSSYLVTYSPTSINEPPEWVGAEPPVIDALTPNSCMIGDPDFTLYVSGQNLFASSVIFFAGYVEPTRVEGDGSLSTGINMAYWNNPDTVKVEIHNGETVSNAVDFTFYAPSTFFAVPAAQDEFQSMHPEREPWQSQS